MTNFAQCESGRIVAVSISLRKSIKKTNIREGRLIEGRSEEHTSELQSR